MQTSLTDAADDAFCSKMYQDYLKDSNRGDFVTFEEALKECGFTLDELQDVKETISNI